MNWEPRPTRFWEEFPEPPKEHFRLSDERRLQAEYMLKHPEIRALTTLLIAHMCKKPLTDRYRHKTLEATARFYMRPAEILQAEIDELLKRKGRMGAGPKMEKKYDSRHIAVPPAVVVPDCICPDQTLSIKSVYSDFISISTSATTLPSVTESALVTPTLEEFFVKMILRGFNKALTTYYSTREHEILYDEAYLCITTCIQKAIEEIWLPILADIKDILGNLLDDVRRISTEQRNLRKRMTDKVPIKINRLKHNFNGYVETGDYPLLKRKDMVETINYRKGTYNRYPKDQFGVYCSKYDEGTEMSTTVEPTCSFPGEEENSDGENTIEEISLQSEEVDT